MAETKTRPTGAGVDTYLAFRASPGKLADCKAILRMPSFPRLVLVGSLVLAGCDPAHRMRRAPVDQRSERVLDGLRPAVAVKGAPTLRWALAERMAALHVPGVSLAVIDSGRLAWAGGFGTRETGTLDSVTTETLFQAQSISKAVAATAMLRFVDQGKLSLDSDVNTYLRSWQVPNNHFTVNAKVTLRRIVSHSAGLTVGGFPGYTLGDSLPALAQILDGLAPANTPAVRVDTFPGATWRYSGGGMLVMQQLLIDVTGETFPALMEREVLTPLGMTHSTYEQPLPVARRDQAASGHDEHGRVMRGHWPVQPEQAAAGLWTTPTDLARWALGVADAWAGRSAHLMSQRTATEMLTEQKDHWGLGVELQGRGDTRWFGHGGANRGFRAQVVMFPALGKGAVIMTNADGGSQLITELLQAIAAEYGWPDFRQVERAVANLDSRLLDSVVGRYDPGLPAPWSGVRIDVTREGNGIFLEIPPTHPKDRIYPASPDSFFTLSGADVVFTRDRTGRAVKVNLGGSGEARRIP